MKRRVRAVLAPVAALVAVATFVVPAAGAAVSTTAPPTEAPAATVAAPSTTTASTTAVTTETTVAVEQTTTTLVEEEVVEEPVDAETDSGTGDTVLEDSDTTVVEDDSEDVESTIVPTTRAVVATPPTTAAPRTTSSLVSVFEEPPPVTTPESGPLVRIVMGLLVVVGLLIATLTWRFWWFTNPRRGLASSRLVLAPGTALTPELAALTQRSRARGGAGAELVGAGALAAGRSAEANGQPVGLGDVGPVGGGVGGGVIGADDPGGYVHVVHEDGPFVHQGGPFVVHGDSPYAHEDAYEHEATQAHDPVARDDVEGVYVDDGEVGPVVRNGHGNGAVVPTPLPAVPRRQFIDQDVGFEDDVRVVSHGHVAESGWEPPVTPAPAARPSRPVVDADDEASGHTVEVSDLLAWAETADPGAGHRRPQNGRRP